MFRPYRGTENDWKVLKENIALARWAGLIPLEQVIDKRVTTGVQPALTAGFPLRPAKPDKAKATLKFEITVEHEAPVDVDYPCVVLFSEKGELLPVFQNLAAKYILSYYLGNGDISITGARQIFDRVRQTSQYGIIFTFSDYDRQGYNIPVALARKLQYWSLVEVDAPPLVVVPLVLDEDEATELHDEGILPVTKRVKTDEGEKQVELYELAALIVLAHKRGQTLEAYIEKRLFDVLGRLLSRKGGQGAVVTWDQYREHHDAQLREIKRAVAATFNQILETSNTLAAAATELGMGVEAFKANTATADGIVTTIENHVKRLIAYTTLAEAVETTRITTADMTLTEDEKKGVAAFEATLDKLSLDVAKDLRVLLKPRENYDEGTERLKDMKAQIAGRFPLIGKPKSRRGK